MWLNLRSYFHPQNLCSKWYLKLALQVGRRRTMSLGSKKTRTTSIGSSGSVGRSDIGNDLRRKTLQIQTKRSREEANQLNLTT